MSLVAESKTVPHEGELVFQKLLDKAPNDHATRLVFADWLQERDDPRAEGYRALARCGFVLCDRYGNPPTKFIPLECSRIFYGPVVACEDYVFPMDWYKLLPGADPENASCVVFSNRRAAEDCAALAFANLPAARREQLLSGVRE